MAIFSPDRPVASASRKHAVVEYDANPTPAKIRKRILTDDRVASGFEIIYAPGACWDDSKFLVLGNEKTLLVGACFLDSIPKLSSVHGKSMADELEILIDPFDDGLSYVQWYFNLSGRTPRVSKTAHNDSEPLAEVIVSTHVPYPDSQSSAFDWVKLRKYRWWDEVITGYAISGLRVRWLFAWFDPREVFRNGKTAGFNIARNRPYIDEFGSWNHASGNGSQDALSLGKLYRSETPATLAGVEATRDGESLVITGTCDGKPADLALTLLDPLGETVAITPSWDGKRFTIRANAGAVGGRYRLKPASASKAVEPGFIAIDVPEAQRAREFITALVYDPPMNIMPTHYAPDRLDRDFGAWKKLGLKRVHWIDYSNWPSFYWMSEFGKYWGKGYTNTFKHCGDFLRAARESAHRQGLEFFADFKTFDLGFNFMNEPKPYRDSSVWDEIEHGHMPVIPEIAAAQDATMAANPAWRREPNLPVSRVVFYSDVELPAFKASNAKVFVSKDNRRYTPLRGAKVRAGTVRRVHQRWTPAGVVPDAAHGAAKNWFIEITGINASAPYLALVIDGKPFELWQRGFMFVEAFGADGKPCVVTSATSGDTKRGFSFWKGWQGWSNQNEAYVQRRSWVSSGVGVVFTEPDTMSTMLEPAHERSRAIWLARVQYQLDAGVDGVSIRTYCHHNGPMHYLKYAYARPVLEAFRSLHGRDPEASDGDYERIRNIRGDCYTRFIADASKLVRSRGKKFCVEIESGAEVPASLGVRMQLPMQWKRWLAEGLLDEIRVKWFSPWSVFVHEEVLPLARRHGVPVHVISRCLHQGPGHRFVETAQLTAGDSARAGFAGYQWYEQNNFMQMNTLGHPMFKGPVAAYFDAVRDTLDAMARSPARPT